MMLRECRKKYGVSIQEAVKVTGIPLRTYMRYESDENYGNSLKRKAMIDELTKQYQITEEKGILTINDIQNGVNEVLNNYKDNVEFCYLFGSYAKGYANGESDVDLCISTTITGLAFFGLVEEIREKLNKKVDLLRLGDMKDNIELINEIMKDGIRIYKK